MRIALFDAASLILPPGELPQHGAGDDLRNFTLVRDLEFTKFSMVRPRVQSWNFCESMLSSSSPMPTLSLSLTGTRLLPASFRRTTSNRHGGNKDTRIRCRRAMRLVFGGFLE